MKNILTILFCIILLNEYSISQTEKSYFIVNELKKDKKIYFSKPTQIQEKERIIYKKDLKKIFEIGGMNDTIIYSPASITTDSKGNLYVADYIGKFVKKFDTKGKFVKQYGRPGKGPGEFVYPTCVYVDSNDKLYVFDDSNLKLTMFYQNKISEFKTIGGIFSEFCPLADNKIIALKSKPNSVNFIYELDNKGKELASLESVIEKNSSLKTSFFLSGFFSGKLLKISEEKFVLVPKYFNAMIFYNGNKIERIISTIDKAKEPRFQLGYQGKNEFFSFSDLDEIIRDAFIINNKIFLLGKSFHKKKKAILFDVYNVDNGLYLYTLEFPIPESFYILHLTAKRLFLLTSEFKIKAYSYE